MTREGCLRDQWNFHLMSLLYRSLLKVYRRRRPGHHLVSVTTNVLRSGEL